MISGLDALVLVGAGIVAGMVGTAGGIASLVSYPALLAVGLPALSANVANIVAVVACGPGSALASGPELQGWAPWLRRYIPISVLGAGLGTALLLLTPAGVFKHVVPFLVAGGSLVLLLQPKLTARRALHDTPAAHAALRITMPIVAAYNGYFGAGSGVMTMALLLITADDRLPTANALKNVLLGAATAASALVLIIFGPVRWSAALPLAAGIFFGGLLGPRITRRVPPSVMRPLVALVGLGLAIQLWISGGA
jgi:uncharacterized membrane protein YfcA